jgi:hypothetical protein
MLAYGYLILLEPKDSDRRCGSLRTALITVAFASANARRLESCWVICICFVTEKCPNDRQLIVTTRRSTGCHTTLRSLVLGWVLVSAIPDACQGVGRRAPAVGSAGSGVQAACRPPTCELAIFARSHYRIASIMAEHFVGSGQLLLGGYVLVPELGGGFVQGWK